MSGSTVLVAAGVVLQCCGFFLAVVDLVGKIREVRRRQRLAHGVNVHPPAATATASALVPAVDTLGHEPTLAERVARLEQRTADLDQRFADTARRAVAEGIAHADVAVQELRADMERADTATAEYVERLGLGDYRMTALGIALFVVGTILGAVR